MLWALSEMRVAGLLCLFLAVSVNANFHSLYQAGVEAYLDEYWQQCIDKLTDAVSGYHAAVAGTVACRRGCSEKKISGLAPEPEKGSPQQDVDEIHVFSRLLTRTRCLIHCRHPHHVDAQAYALMDNMRPYEYLHLCYFQKGMYQEAASAAFTFLEKNPNDPLMVKNLKYYSNLPEVDVRLLKNYEAKKYVKLFNQGTEAYHDQKYSEVIKLFEASLKDLLNAEEDCRAYCEGPFDQGWLPDFVSSVANHYTFNLKCKMKCASKLNNLNGEVHDDLLPSHYHYLQYAYYKEGNLNKACEAVGSYLLFYPDDETMNNNRDYYLRMPEVSEDLFEPRPEITKYKMRKNNEQKMLKFIEKEFQFKDIMDNRIIKSSKKKKRFEKNSKNRLQLYNNQKIQFQMIDQNNIYPNMSMKADLSQDIGQGRMLVDDVADPNECQELIHLAEIAAVEGDGYHGNISPHSKYEHFEGTTLSRAALLVYFGLMEPSVLKLFLDLSDLGQEYIENQFSIKEPLYSSYTHLVCRSAKSDAPIVRNDFSHLIHADNCILFDDNTCIKTEPAYIWRDYSAILYLNSEFEGGQFVFAKGKRIEDIQVEVKPKCGRLIGFTSGSENLHGVRAVVKGKRCALAMWFTFNASHSDQERELAWKVLDQVRNQGSISDQLLYQLRNHIN